MCDKNLAEYCFTWKIQNYSLCCRDKTKFESPIFTPDNFQGSKWYLTFIPSYEINKKNYISCYLCRNKKDLCGEEITISFIIEVIDGNNKIIATRGDKTSTNKFLRGRSWGWDSFTTVENVTSKCMTWNKDILTIRCQMFTTTYQSESVALTEIGLDKYSFQWKLKLSDCVVAAQMKEFSLSETSKYEISVTAPNDLIKIQVKRTENNQSSHRLLRGNISLLNQKKVKVLSQSANHLFDVTDVNNIWNFTSFITKKQLEDNEEYYLNGSFSFLCEFSAANGEKTSEILSSTTSFESNCDNLLNLQDDLSNLFTDMEHSDVELRCGNTNLRAHKSILTARSSVFSAMFHHDMIEKQSGVVDIPNADPKTLKSFLEFIYSGKVEIRDYESALKLLMIANEYQVLSLKDTCSMFLMSSISLENACEILSFADMFNLKQLKKCALDYFAQHMKEILNLSQWSEFKENEKNLKLSMEIISHLANGF